VGLAAAIAIILWQAWRRDEDVLVPVGEIMAYEHAHVRAGKRT
jgi:hypothetical protein